MSEPIEEWRTHAERSRELAQYPGSDQATRDVSSAIAMTYEQCIRDLQWCRERERRKLVDGVWMAVGVVLVVVLFAIWGLL